VFEKVDSTASIRMAWLSRRLDFPLPLRWIADPRMAVGIRE
jgi:hypothetical protein